jgi:L-asparaginase
VQIAVLATGGTIVARRDDDGHLVVTDEVHELLALVQVPEGVNLVGTQFCSVPSFVLAPNDMLAIVRKVRDLLDSGFEGVVVTHGTDTLEETAYLMSQYFARDTRLVLTGAQRGADEPDSDGQRNLSDALKVVGGPIALGPVVVVGGQVVAAVEARKVHT